MSYAQVAQHHKDNNAQKEKQQKNEQPVAAPTSNGKHANSATGRTANDSRDSRGELDWLLFVVCT